MLDDGEVVSRFPLDTAAINFDLLDDPIRLVALVHLVDGVFKVARGVVIFVIGSGPISVEDVNESQFIAGIVAMDLK